MNEKQLYKGFITIIDNIYTPKKSYQRIIQFFKTSNSPKTQIKVPTKFGLKDIIIVLRIIFYLGIKDTNRKYFWKLIVWTFFNQRKNIDKAVFYGIMIYQMHKTHKQIKISVTKQIEALG